MKGLLHVYTGAGKGKSTAALGLALRAAGWGMKTCVFQFLKKGVNGEMMASRSLGPNFKIVTFGQIHPIFCEKSERRKAATALLRKRMSSDLKAVKEAFLLGRYDVIILDEINNCLAEKFIKKEEVLDLINLKPTTCELIMTGRNAPRWLIDMADYATNMRLLKHPYAKGVKARKGIEW